MADNNVALTDKGSYMPDVSSLETGLAEASVLIDDIVLKKYLNGITNLEVVPLPEDLKRINDTRIFKITEMVYQKDEYSTYKFASVFNAVQNLNCTVFIIADSNGDKTEFYMGIRSFDGTRTPKSLRDTLKNALIGQFPGVQTIDMLDPDTECLLGNIAQANITAVSCIANNKDKDFKEDKKFIQGLEKLALAMQGQRYTAIILAKSVQSEELEAKRNAYQTIYTQLSPFANMQLSYGTNEALSISNALSHGITKGSSISTTDTTTTGTSHSIGSSDSVSKGKTKSVGFSSSYGTSKSILPNILSGIARGLFGGVATTMSQTFGFNSSVARTTTKTHTDSVTDTESRSKSVGVTHGTTESVTDTQTKTIGNTTGTSQNMQLTMQNKTLIDNLERIGKQLKRLEECESLGMWECAAYFMSDNQQTAEMAAGTYKALMRGTNTGIETAAINYWGHNDTKLPILREYITNFVHPVFVYNTESANLPVTPVTLVSGNELAIQMGLPRKSVCGFPVVEHADFGKEVVSYNGGKPKRDFCLGKVFNMGTTLNTDVKLDADSLTMHTFITGSTGAGKSNAVYEILRQLHDIYRIPFLVIEPAKGEYKNVFSQYPQVSVYGTNPKKSALLKINPFSFPDDVHVLEHLDRLVEIFNVCWPMYAAMPAILKEAMENAYRDVGWNLEISENKYGRKFPNFVDLMHQIEAVVNDSKYSGDTKGDYSGALLTRVRSLTTGLNRLIFANDELSDEELYDKSVIADLSRVGSTETKSLIMGLLVMKLNEHRMSCGVMNSPLKHITVLEEAHNLLKRVSTEQSSESSNLIGKSVELLANSIAEMRTYGEGFIIADQAPGLLDMSVIRNTNTKIILRLPDKNDRELVGYAAGLKKEQIDELSKLDRGVAAIYQNGWVEPVLVQIAKCGLEEIQVCYDGCEMQDSTSIRNQLINMLIAGRMDDSPDFSVEDIENGLHLLGLSTQQQDQIRGLLDEFRQNNELTIWQDEEFRRLSNLVVELLGVRQGVRDCLIAQDDYESVTAQLENLAHQNLHELSPNALLVLCQCFMKDMSVQEENAENAHELYENWFEYMKHSLSGGIR